MPFDRPNGTTGFTAVSKFKPYLPVQWAIGTHGKDSNRMKTYNFENEPTNKIFSSKAKFNLRWNSVIMNTVNSLIYDAPNPKT